MHYSHLIRQMGYPNHWVAKALHPKPRGGARNRGTDSTLRTSATDPDLWYRSNVGARSQSDFWLRMLVSKEKQAPQSRRS